jgi:hypothetical protein
MAGWDKASVRDVLSGTDVLSHFGLTRRERRGDWYRFRWCPACGKHARAAFAVHARTAQYTCHRCGIHGSDVLALVALLSGMDIERDFVVIIARAAEIAGLGEPSELSDEERRQRHAEHERRRARERQQEANRAQQRRQRAWGIASRYWEDLHHRHLRGEAYLRSRALGDLVGRHDLVRFTVRGDVCLPLYDSAGDIINVPRRLLEPAAGPKVINLRGCPQLGTFGRWPDVRTADRVYVVEGLFDYLSGYSLWGDRVLGAHGASMIPRIVEGIAPYILAERPLVLVPHRGDATRVGEKAVELARGKVRRAWTDLFDVTVGGYPNYTGCQDLNDYLRVLRAGV